jgi:hypothetical protein
MSAACPCLYYDSLLTVSWSKPAYTCLGTKTSGPVKTPHASATSQLTLLGGAGLKWQGVERGYMRGC